MGVDISIKEVVKDLLDVIDSGGKLHGNRRALAEHDAESADKYVTELEEQIEETEYIIYNAEDWIDPEVDEMEKKFEEGLKFFSDISSDDEQALLDLVDDITETLKKQLAKQMMVELAKVPQVYTR